ncbi:MAG: efflux transporter outer membrane subunit [Methylophaga sp.]|nr:efflux transporter outer membrane subunit [Methylophaga sp.]
MRVSRLTPLVIIALFSTSCVTNTTKQDSQKAADEAVGKLDVPNNWTAPDLIKYEDVHAPTKWIESFNDPVMLKLIEEGKANNLNLKVTAANMDKAWLLADQSNSALKPTADLSLGANQAGGGKGNSSTTGQFNVGVNVSWELDVWGRLKAGIDAATANAQSVEADYIYAQQSLSASIAKSYLKVIETKLQTDLTKKNQATLEKTMHITQVRYDNGMTSAQDVAVNKSNLAVVEEQLITLEGSQRDALRALEVLLGRYPSASADTPDGLPDLPLSPPAGIPSEVLERRPDVVSAERKIAQAYNATYQAKTAHLPKFSLTADLSNASGSLLDILNPTNLLWQLASNIVAPLFDDGKRKIDTEIATVEQKQAVSNYAQTALTAFSEVETDLDQGGTLARREIALTEVLTQSNKAYRIADLRYKEGEIGLLDTLQLQQQAIAAESNLISIKRLQLEQRINLYLALGGSW